MGKVRKLLVKILNFILSPLGIRVKTTPRAMMTLKVIRTDGTVEYRKVKCAVNKDK